MSDVAPPDPAGEKGFQEILAAYREMLRTGQYQEQQALLERYPDLADFLLRDRAVFEPTGRANLPSANESKVVDVSAGPLALPAGEETPPEDPLQSRQWRLWCVLLCVCPLYLGLFVGGSEARLFAVAGLESIPFVILAVFAYAGQRHLWAFVLTLMCLAVIGGCSGLLNLALAAAFSGGDAKTLPVTLAGLMVSYPLGGLCLVRPVRVWLAQFLPIDPHSFVHATALAIVTALTVNSLVVAAAFPKPPALSLAEHDATDHERSRDEHLLTDVYVVVWLVPAAFLMVGYPVQRNFREACQRLGLRWPRPWQLVFAVAAAAILLVALHFENRGVQRLWKTLNWPITDETALQALFGWAANPVGAVVIGIAAGLGEELGVRGVLQPRIGILLSNAFFTSLHAFEYRFDALVTVFVLGLALGFIRKWTNTTTSALVHGLFDAAALLLP
jgi:uncharacterized protein